MANLHHMTHEGPRGRTSAIVSPEWGANILAFAYKDQAWQWPVPVLEAVDIATVAMSPGSYGAPLLAPTPGRIGLNQNGAFSWNGDQHQISPARHGWLRGAVWEIDDKSDSSITCTARFHPDSKKCTLPFDFSARHKVSLSDATVRSDVYLMNEGAFDLPMDLGWHPYLHRNGPCRVHIPAAKLWALNDQPEPTPTGQLLDVTGQTDFRVGRTVAADEHWDNIFFDLQPDRSGWVDSWVEATEQITLKSGGQSKQTVRRHVRINHVPTSPRIAPVRNMQLFTPPGRNAISLEPLSSVPDALNLSSQGIDQAKPNIIPAGGTSNFQMEMAISVLGD